jgi:hypothetical protein
MTTERMPIHRALLGAAPGRFGKPALLILASVLVLSSFKPFTHLSSSAHVLAGLSEESVTILGVSYPVDPRVGEALRDHPAYYRAGVIGPDGFPDILFGQSQVHPDSRCDNGRLEDAHCQEGAGYSFSHEWLNHVYRSGWEYYERRGGDVEAKRALAFTYGYLTHAAGDLWAHTLVNELAGGIFPGQAEMVASSARRDIALRHIVVEGYIGKRTPPTSTTIAAPREFIYETFITSATARRLARDSHFDRFWSLRENIRTARDDLDRTVNAWCVAGEAALPGLCSAELARAAVNEAIHAYATGWIARIDAGLRAWPAMGERVAIQLFTHENMDGALDQIDRFATDHIAGMIAGPVGDIVEYAAEIDRFASGLVPLHFEPLKELEAYLFREFLGMSPAELESLARDADHWIRQPELGFTPETPLRLDSLMAVGSGDRLSPAGFAAYHNATLLSRLLLLDPTTLDRFLFDRHVGPLYTGSRLAAGGQGEMQRNVMLGFHRSLDGNHQWRARVPPNAVGGGARAGAGMPLWSDCLGRTRVFRRLFADWDGGHFPDDGEPCRFLSDPLPPVSVVLPLANTSREACFGVPVRSELRNHQGPDSGQQYDQPYAYYVRVRTLEPITASAVAESTLSTQSRLPARTLSPMGAATVPAGTIVFHRVVRGTLPRLGVDELSVTFASCTPGTFSVEVFLFEEMYALPAEHPANVPIAPRPPYFPLEVEAQSFRVTILPPDRCPLVQSPEQTCTGGRDNVVSDPFCLEPNPARGGCAGFGPLDADDDGVPDAEQRRGILVAGADNCPVTPNPDQTDSDDDGVGDACEILELSADLLREVDAWLQGRIPDERVARALERTPRATPAGGIIQPCLSCPEERAHFSPLLRAAASAGAEGRTTPRQTAHRLWPLAEGVSYRVANAAVTGARVSPSEKAVYVGVEAIDDAILSVDLPAWLTEPSPRPPAITVRVDGLGIRPEQSRSGATTTLTFPLRAGSTDVRIDVAPVAVLPRPHR